MIAQGAMILAVLKKHVDSAHHALVILSYLTLHRLSLSAPTSCTSCPTPATLFPVALRILLNRASQGHHFKMLIYTDSLSPPCSVKQHKSIAAVESRSGKIRRSGRSVHIINSRRLSNFLILGLHHELVYANQHIVQLLQSSQLLYLLATR